MTYLPLLMSIALTAADVPKEGSTTSLPVLVETGVKDIDGHTHDLEGRLAVFVFIKTGCPIANYYQPTLSKLAQRWGDDVALVQVHTEAKRSIEDLRSHRRTYDVAGVIVHDADGQLVEAIDASITPEAVVVDAHGVVRYRGRIDDKYLGFGKSRQVVSTHDLADAVDAVVAGTAVLRPRTKAVGCVIRRRARSSTETEATAVN